MRHLYGDDEWLTCYQRDEQLTRFLLSVGPATGTGFGMTGISWSELAQWATVMHVTLTPFEAEALHLMSQHYASEFNEVSREKVSTRPFETEDNTATRREQVVSVLDKAFGSMVSKK